MLEGHYDILSTSKINVGWTNMGPKDDTSEKFIRIMPTWDDGAYLTRKEAEELVFAIRKFLHAASDQEFKRELGYLESPYAGEAEV